MASDLREGWTGIGSMRTAPYVLVTYSALSLADGNGAHRALRINPARTDVQRAAAALAGEGAASFSIDEVVGWLRAHGNERARESVREALQADVASAVGATARVRPGVYVLREPRALLEPKRAASDARRHCADALLVAAGRLGVGGEVTRARLVNELDAAGVAYSVRSVTAGLSRLVSVGCLSRVAHGRYRLGHLPHGGVTACGCSCSTLLEGRVPADALP